MLHRGGLKLLHYLDASRVKIPSQPILSRREIPRASLVILGSCYFPDSSLQLATIVFGRVPRVGARAHARGDARAARARVTSRPRTYTPRDRLVPRTCERRRARKAERVCEHRRSLVRDGDDEWA